MATRPIPVPRVVYSRVSETAHFQLNRPEDRKLLSQLREREVRGEVEIDYITLPPQIDQRGVPHVTALYWVKRLLTQEEIERLEKKNLEEMAKAGPSRPQPLPSAGMGLTAEERELLAPFRGNKNDE